MANEITSGPGDGHGNYPLLFLFPIATPVQWAGTASNVIPTPSNTLPEWAAALVTQAEKADLDSGVAMFYVYTPFRTDGLTGAQMIAQARLLYAQLMAERLSWYANTYKYPGNRINAV